MELISFLHENTWHLLCAAQAFKPHTCRHLQVDDLTKGALVVKEDLAKVELYGCMAALKDVRAKCVKMNECIIKALKKHKWYGRFDMNIRQCENYGISREHA